MNTFLSKASRTAQLGLIARDAARVRSARDDVTRRQAQRHLVERLGAMRGLPQKVGQMLSLSEATAEEQVFTPLTESQDDAIPFEEFAAILDRELGQPWQSIYSSIESQGAAASLAQVHRGVLLDGTPVAIKVQYPGIRDALWTDLQALGWLSAPVGGLRRGFDMEAYQREVKTIVDRELDYRQEVATMTAFANRAKSMPSVVVPQVIPSLSRPTVITMRWVDGEKISAAARWSLEDRQAVTETLIELFLRSCMQWRILHGDPHAGNYRFEKTADGPRVGLLDFGCCKLVSNEVAHALRHCIEWVIEGSIANRAEEIMSHLVLAGFNRDLLEPMADRLPKVIEALFAPFACDGEFDTGQWDLSAAMERALGDMRWNFRIAGPADLIVFIRAFQGLVQYTKALDSPVDWRAIFRDVAADCSAIDLRDDKKIDNVQSDSAKYLVIRVMERGSMKAKVTFKASVISELESILPEELPPKLEARGIDINEISARACREGLRAQELFSLGEGEKDIRVWLE